MTSNTTTTTEPEVSSVKALTAALAAPFHDDEVKWKAQVVKGNRAMPVAYVDARTIQDRLDDVLGVEGWQDEYQLLPDHSVLCRLRLKLGNRWITKMDVGSPSEQPDGGDRLKAAFSDALKRAAVKFGLARYLYRLESQWCDYDPVKKQFVERPKLPRWAQATISPAPIPTPTPPAEKKSASKASAAKSAPATSIPSNGSELHRRLRDYDAELHKQGLCPLGALLAHITQIGIKAGHGGDLTAWSGPAIALAVEETKKFRASLLEKAAA